MLFAVYILFFAVAVPRTGFQGDEQRYLVLSRNLTHGYYSPPGEVNLWNGPGYPLLLTPFYLLKLSPTLLRAVNVPLLWAAIFYIYQFLLFYIPRSSLTRHAWVLGLYPPFVYHLHLLLSEVLAVFLVAGFSYHCCRFVQKGKWADGLVAVIFLAWLTLTKVIFGYVVPVSILFLLLLFWQRKNFRRLMLVLMIGFIFCVPYLLYTYSLTGNIFYWSNAGGMQLYWMSSPYAEDFGDWHSASRVRRIPGLAKNHARFFGQVSKQHNSVLRDQAFMRRAIVNIRSHPDKFVRNWLMNIGRIFLGWPYSHRYKPWWQIVAYALPNIVLMLLVCAAVYATKTLPWELYALSMIAIIYLFASSLVSAYGRSLTPVVPVILVVAAIACLRIRGPMRSHDRIAKRVIFLMPSLGRGGAERVASIFLPWLAQKYHVTLVLIMDWIEYPVPPEIEVICLSASRQGKISSLLHAPLHFIKMCSIIKRLNPAIVISFMEQANIINMMSSTLLPHKTLIGQRVDARMQHKGLMGYIVGKMARRFYPKANLVYAVSQGVADSVTSIYKVAPERIKVLPNPVDHKPSHKEEALEAAKPFLLHVGRINFRHKRQDLLLRVFGRLDHSELKLVFLGEGPDQSELEHRSIGRNVIIAGWHKPVPYMEQAEMLILCSRHEGWPNVLNEAMACGCPVVAFDCPSGPAEILDNGRYGTLVPDGDETGLQKAIEDLLADPIRQKYYRKQSLKRAADFAAEKICPRFVNMVEQTIMQ